MLKSNIRDLTASDFTILQKTVFFTLFFSFKCNLNVMKKIITAVLKLQKNKD